MDKRPFRFRHVHKISVAFVLTALTLILGAFLYTGYVQGWLEPTTNYWIELPDDGTSGLEVGAQVTILGNKVGVVEVIELRREDGLTKLKPGDEISTDAIKLVAVVGVKGEFTRFIGEDSGAELKSGLGGFGAAYFEISRGNTPRTKDGGELKFRVEKGMQDDVSEVLAMVKDKVGPLLDSVTKTSDSVNDLILTFTSESESFQKTLASLRDTMEAVNNGDGAVNTLLNDESFRDDLTGTLAKVEETMGELKTTASELNVAIGDFNEKTMPNLNKAVAGVPDFLDTTKETIKSAGGKIEELDMENLNATIENADLAMTEFEKLMISLYRFPLLRPFAPSDKEMAEKKAKDDADEKKEVPVVELSPPAPRRPSARRKR